MRKVVVTGGFGFIGFKLAGYLRDKGIEVVVIEHPTASVPVEDVGLQVLRADIANEESLEQIKLRDIDAVLHLAGQSSGPRSFSIPLIDVRSNILGTINTINWCVDNHVDRLLFASSFVVYGDHPEREALDESVPCRPRSVYATSKLACEHLLQNYAEPKGVRWNALRMFNVYGPGQDLSRADQGVVGIFMSMLREQDVVQVHGSLDRFRDLTYVGDIIQGWDRCLHGQAFNEVFNVGSGVKTTFRELIELLALVMGKDDRLRIEQGVGTPGDVMGSVADLTRVKAALGYEPQHRLVDGLRRMWSSVETTVT